MQTGLKTITLTSMQQFSKDLQHQYHLELFRNAKSWVGPQATETGSEVPKAVCALVSLSGDSGATKV